MKSDQNRAILAVVLSGIILFSWQYFFSPPQEKSLNQEITSNSAPIEEQKSAGSIEPQQENTGSIGPATNLQEQVYKIVKDGTFFEFNQFLTFKNAQNFDGPQAKEVFENEKLLSFKFLSAGVVLKTSFNLSKISDSEFKGLDTLNNLSVNLSFNESGKLKIDFEKIDNSKIDALKIVFSTSPKSKDSYTIRKYAFAGTELETIDVGDDEKTIEPVKWLGMDYNYHLFALTFTEKTSLPIETKSDNPVLNSNISFNKNKLSLGLVYLKKEYDSLIKAGDNLHLSVDFGLFSFIAIPILRGLQYFYSLISNYGIAIILLTIVIRLLTFPLQYKSTKSMKKMQQVQPQLKKIQEKYKNDPKRLQAESMTLFKKAGANPFSGCFPLLLQMPVFFAFYKVLYNAVELVNAPFILWIKDLSSKDPYYVLPVLMTLAMFLQQKVTPTATTDKAQQKVMMFMPLVFGFIMKDLPSGLNLYIFISTLIAIILQALVLKKIK